MIRHFAFFSLLLSAPAVLPGQPVPQGENVIFMQRVPAPPTAGIAGERVFLNREPFTIQFMGAEMAIDPVKGAPYSAQAVTEVTQVLPDGNRIQRKMTSMVYRDSEGRTRREQSGPGFGPLAPADGGPEFIMIADPVAGTSYMLNPRERIAHKTGVRSAVQIRHKVEEGRQIFERRIHVDVLKDAPRPPDAKTESLGVQTIEGVQAEGTRTVTVIPAGQIGNERPIEIVSERWFSPELKTVVMSTNKDPRSGETVYRLTGIDRSEPQRSLFEVPPDYTVAGAK